MHNPGFSSFRTPFYLYDLDLLDRTLTIAGDEASRYGFRIHYATKANYDDQVLRRIRKAGFGVDCVSGNEVSFAIEQGFSPESLVFAGVGKSDIEIEEALHHRILCLNIESVEELWVVAEIAARLKTRAPVVLRVNPDIPALTHQYITTGLKENKFGIPQERLQEALDFCSSHPWINFLGLHFHIGSQITSLQPFTELCQAANRIWSGFAIDSYGGKMINLGGGLGVNYSEPVENPVPDFHSFFKLFHENLQIPGHVSRHFELGRSLTAQCGRLVTRVLFVKHGTLNNHVIVDTGMTELIRPALYGASHCIENITADGKTEPYDVVGPICESSDCFGKEVFLPATSRGDFLVIHSCGAYAESMGMNYNLRGAIGKLYVKGGMLRPGPRLQLQIRHVPSAKALHEVLPG